ncbi:MAG: bifunctional histidinol-phosphatase/imidazoleglycerol-phosphate dehydratase HisB [Gammaproteobacteria bacterium]|nr:bifunctional histidinol-phosphatase/imidazoleglycerol-phosphate dehydratase HisB [Gammaproteobacteria bacterium]
MTPARIAFLDRDGTLIVEPPDQQIDDLRKLELVTGVIPALLRLRDAGYEFVMVTNQDGLGTASFPEPDFRGPQEFLLRLLASQGICFRAVFVCPHRVEDGCACRKPRTGLLTQFLTATPLDRAASVVVGDRDTDLQLAVNLGLRGMKIDPRDPAAWAGIAHSLVDQPRTAEVRRETRETSIGCVVDLDAEGPISIRTGIGFFDHMLEQLAKHGGFSLKLECKGDLEVDEHHTIEDCALALGEALRRALATKRGIGRYGFVLPMDEAQSRVAVDLSGRAYFVFEGGFTRSEVGGLPTELVPHFFRSLADSLGAAIQISVKGENSHHMVEACFKGVGRALRQAFARQGTELPTTKGVL